MLFIHSPSNNRTLNVMTNHKSRPEISESPSIVLWGTPHSLYTGKARSYLIKKGLPFREKLPSDPRFMAEIVPAAGHFVVPIIELADGTVVQDTSEIIDVLESRYPDRPMTPATPVQGVLAHLLAGFGSEGLLPIGMHYRWTYRAEQERFLQAEFGRAVHVGPDREERLAAGAQLMEYFNGFLPGLGITAETIPAFEQACEELFELLDIHFQHYPYLMGGYPSIADFGFMAPLYAHLSRDPVPGAMMKQRAPNLYRWTERMNQPVIADSEYPGQAEDWYPDDSIPATLDSVLKLVFQDWLPQLRAEAEFVNAWLKTQPALPPGAVASVDGERAVHPVLGEVSYAWRGVDVPKACMPQGLWHFERAASRARGLDGEARARLMALLERLGGDGLMDIRLDRPLVRTNGVLVFG